MDGHLQCPARQAGGAQQRGAFKGSKQVAQRLGARTGWVSLCTNHAGRGHRQRLPFRSQGARGEAQRRGLAGELIVRDLPCVVASARLVAPAGEGVHRQSISLYAASLFAHSYPPLLSIRTPWRPPRAPPPAQRRSSGPAARQARHPRARAGRQGEGLHPPPAAAHGRACRAAAGHRLSASLGRRESQQRPQKGAAPSPAFLQLGAATVSSYHLHMGGQASAPYQPGSLLGHGR